MWWILVAPESLKVYQQVYGEGDEYRVGSWLASSLAWLPLLVITLALWLGTIPRSDVALSPISYLGVSVGLVMVYFLTALMSRKYHDIVFAKGRAAVHPFLVLFLFSAIESVIEMGVLGGVGYSLSAICEKLVLMACSMFPIAFGIIVSPERAREFFGAVAGVFGVVLIILGVVQGVAIGVLLVTNAVFSFILWKGLERVLFKRTSLLMRGVPVMILLSFAFLIWYGFGDGWRVFRWGQFV